jgi:N-acetylglucosaminyldiphosphoundecaprenol N-acetyl-beta-D-mannosaminyltransferase
MSWSSQLITRRTSLLGTPVDCCSRLEFGMFLERAVKRASASRIITLNPEIALEALYDARYAGVVRTADLITIDGVGVSLALRLLRRRSGERITGNDVLAACGSLAEKAGLSMVFVLRIDGLTSPPILRAALSARWPRLDAVIVTADPSRPLDSATIRSLRERRPTILITNFGHPLQDSWIAANVDNIPSVRVAAGIGGAIDYFSGVVAPPHPSIRRMGLEWAWRLVRQPRRSRRIFNATLVFSSQVLRDVVTRPIQHTGLLQRVRRRFVPR